MRVVMLGKGGSGKSTLAGLLCAELAGRGGRVVAFDADTVPGLGPVLGMPATDDWFLGGAARREGGGWRLDGTPSEIVERSARPAPGGVRFVQIGNASQPAGLRAVPGALPRPVVGHDGLQHRLPRLRRRGRLGRRRPPGRHAQRGGRDGRHEGRRPRRRRAVRQVVAHRPPLRRDDGWPPGVRLAGVASKVASPDDEAYVREELDRLGLALWASVPLDPAVRRAERVGQPLTGIDAGSPVRRAVSALADLLEEAAAAAPSAAGARA